MSNRREQRALDALIALAFIDPEPEPDLDTCELALTAADREALSRACGPDFLARLFAAVPPRPVTRA